MGAWFAAVLTQVLVERRDPKIPEPRRRKGRGERQKQELCAWLDVDGSQRKRTSGVIGKRNYGFIYRVINSNWYMGRVAYLSFLANLCPAEDARGMASIGVFTSGADVYRISSHD